MLPRKRNGDRGAVYREMFTGSSGVHEEEHEAYQSKKSGPIRTATTTWFSLTDARSA
jgi:hypothetical protein